jgi:hypothetical protein
LQTANEWVTDEIRAVVFERLPGLDLESSCNERHAGNQDVPLRPFCGAENACLELSKEPKSVLLVVSVRTGRGRRMRFV